MSDKEKISGTEAEHKWEGICFITAVMFIIFMIIFFTGDPDIHDAIIQYLMK